MKVIQIILLVAALGLCGFAVYRFVINKMNPGQATTSAQVSS